MKLSSCLILSQHHIIVYDSFNNFDASHVFTVLILYTCKQTQIHKFSGNNKHRVSRCQLVLSHRTPVSVFPYKQAMNRSACCSILLYDPGAKLKIINQQDLFLTKVVCLCFTMEFYGYYEHFGHHHCIYVFFSSVSYNSSLFFHHFLLSKCSVR